MIHFDEVDFSVRRSEEVISKQMMHRPELISDEWMHKLTLEQRSWVLDCFQS